MSTMEREFGWDDIIENDGADFVLLPEGDYDFKVTAFERGRHQGSSSLPACNKAIVSITIEAPQGKTTIQESLFLHTKGEWKLCEFFTAIGQRKRGEKLQMNWNRVVGSSGRCKVYVDNWTNDKGDQKQNNKIKKFYEPEAGTPTTTNAAAPSFIPGNF